MDDDSDSVQQNLLAWLGTEGYPLEFAAARAFTQAGFGVHQGYFTAVPETEQPREIDVVATMDRHNEVLIRIDHVIECKWSGDKPWVLFCGGHGISTAACITQSIASELAETLLWKEAGRRELQTLELFSTRRDSAFGGRQGFSGSRDVLFDAVRAVTTLSRAVAAGYDGRTKHESDPLALPQHAVVVFPIIVVDGRIFEARQGDPDLELLEVTSSRIYWRGGGRLPHAHTVVDIVRSDHLDEFARQRAHDSSELLKALSTATDELRSCISRGSLEELSVPPASRGVVGTPSLLARISQSLAAQRELESGPTEDSEH